MNTNLKILSTKKLAKVQEQLFVNNGLEITSFNAIKIDFLPNLNLQNTTNAIITSQNGARAILKNKIDIQNVFCVGIKTKSLLVENGYNVVEMTKNASELAKIVVKNYKNKYFVFYCGNKRRDELPDYLTQNNIVFKEQIVYNTRLISEKFTQNFDGVLFFSPSGVQSYVRENSLKNCIAFCIGKTTAQEAKKYTKNIQISEETSVESLIEITIPYFRS